VKGRDIPRPEVPHCASGDIGSADAGCALGRTEGYFPRSLIAADGASLTEPLDEAALADLAGVRIVLGEPGMGKNELMGALGRRLGVEPVGRAAQHHPAGLGGTTRRPTSFRRYQPQPLWAVLGVARAGRIEDGQVGRALSSKGNDYDRLV
jgi:hypothetical protein